MANTNFLGLGWNFPVRVRPDGSGQIALAPDSDEDIRQSIWTILATSPGERVMRPDFGCGIHDLVFGVNNAAMATAVTAAVREALAVWEPRIDVLDAYAAPDPARPNVLVIEINYQVRSTNSRFNLVYPFYLE
jgi:phage baseplate assembly protein W